MATTTDIQIVNLNNFEKIQNFLNDSRYKEILENSETFNTRTNIERRLRMPFLDPQTGVAQNHCALFMKQKQRMPGFREGQIYTYPSKRWHKPKRQYMLHHQSYKAYQFRETHYIRSQPQEISAGISSDGNSMGATADNDSKDSHRNEEENKWYYDEMELTHVEDFEEDFDTDNDFDESYNNKGRRKRAKANSRKNNNPDGVTTPAKRGRRAGRKPGGEGRRRGGGNSGMSSSSSTTALLPSISASITSSATTSVSATATTSASTIISNLTTSPAQFDEPTSALTPESKIPSGDDSLDGQPLSQLAATAAAAAANSPAIIPPPVIPAPSTSTANNTPTPSPSTSKKGPKPRIERTEPQPRTEVVERIERIDRADRGKAAPSPYCDFCLGDARENKKTNLAEELVSCSDCGRSGHPSCLQFTENMIISVKRYRWQCIECKYCSICGTSDNDDQLLFCDDCDRGYHMYCLTPPLSTPPEGSWSCKLCIEEFHSK